MRVFNEIISVSTKDESLADLREISIFITKKFLSQQKDNGFVYVIIREFSLIFFC